MTERWGYVVALPLCDYYNEEIWRRVFPPNEDDEMSDHKYVPVRLSGDTGQLHDKIQAALKIAWQYGATDGGHHKMWVINQMIDALTNGGLWEFRENYEKETPDGDTYSWDEGSPP